MAAPDLEDAPDWLILGKALTTKVDRWTADLAMKLLPESNGPKVEIVAGRAVVSPHAGVDHQIIAGELYTRLRPAARQAEFRAYLEINVIDGDDLYIPDLAVLRTSAAGKASVDIADALMLVEIASDSNRRKDVIDRPRLYAAAKVPWFMRIEFRRRVPSIALHELIDGAYEPVLACAAGTTFAMSEPFPFSIDPGELLDD
jgi:Putative restriction endonuclease